MAARLCVSMSGFSLVSLIILSVVSLCTAEYVDLSLLDSDKYPNAKCLDGTTAGFYFQEASSPEQSKKFVIYLNGGGECDNEPACLSAMGTKLGSSKYFKKQYEASGWYLGSDNCKHNRDFCEWNHIFNPYCSQDLHSGQQTEPNEWGVHFAGHHIQEAIMDELEDRLSVATDIMVTGASAGGLGVWMTVDWVAKRYPQARVTGVSIAGLYFYASYYTGPHAIGPSSMADFREEAFPTTYALYNAHVDEDCAKALPDPSACMLLNNSLPYIDSDIFVIQAQTDQVVLEGHDCFPGDPYMNGDEEKQFLQDWHANMTVALQPIIRQERVNANGKDRKLGAFAAACYTHTNFTASHPFIQGENFYQPVHRWYFADQEGYKADSYVLHDDCGELCNPTCDRD